MSRRLAAALMGLGAALAIGLAPGVASAGVTPSPTPTTTHNFLPGPPPPPKLAAENFDGLDSSINPLGYVVATGPVRGTGGTDRTVSSTLDVFGFGGSTVRVDHAAIPQPTIYPASCSAVIDAPNLWWTFNGGTGTDKHATGHGDVTVVALFSFSQRDGKCPLDGQGYLSQANGQPCYRDHGRQIEPTFWSVEFQGEGVASLKHQPQPQPQPCPCSESPTPVYSTSTDAYLTR